MQRSYKKELVPAIEGGLAYEITPQQVLSRVGTTDIPFGRFVTQGPNDDQVHLPVVAGDVTGTPGLLGISRRTQFIESAPVSAATEESDAYVPAIIPQGEAFNVEKKGPIWMLAEQDCTPANNVFVRTVANVAFTPGTPGSFRIDADAGNATQASNCRILTSAKAGGFVIIDCDF